LATVIDTRYSRHGTSPPIIWKVKLETVEEIKKLGLEYTIIVTGLSYEWFFSASTGFDHKNGKVFSLGNVKVSTSLTDDVAKVTSFYSDHSFV
jgi:hypothetical protein